MMAQPMEMNVISIRSICIAGLAGRHGESVAVVVAAATVICVVVVAIAAENGRWVDENCAYALSSSSDTATVIPSREDKEK